MEPTTKQYYQDKEYTEAEVDTMIALAEIKIIVKELAKTCVKRTEFLPVQRLVYGATGLMLTSVIVALIVSVIP